MAPTPRDDPALQEEWELYRARNPELSLRQVCMRIGELHEVSPNTVRGYLDREYARRHYSRNRAYSQRRRAEKGDPLRAYHRNYMQLTRKGLSHYMSDFLRLADADGILELEAARAGIAEGVLGSRLLLSHFRRHQQGQKKGSIPGPPYLAGIAMDGSRWSISERRPDNWS